MQKYKKSIFKVKRMLTFANILGQFIDI